MKKITILIFCILTSLVTYAQTEPSNQPTNLDIFSIKAYSLKLKFTEVAGAGRYLVLKSSSEITDVPLDGENYLIGERIGESKVVGTGSFKSQYKIKECVANTTYHFAVFAYNTSGTNTNYKTDSPLSGSQTSKGADFDGFYDDYRIDVTSSIEDLTDLLYSHTQLVYGDYDDKVVENVLEKDTVVSGSEKHYIIGEYSNIRHVYNGSIDFNDYNREHVTAKSWMPSDPSNNSTRESSDYFNLFLVKANVNQVLRSAYVFDEVVNTNSVEAECKNGDNADGLMSFEPKESIKGDVARTLFYQIVTYDGKGGSWAFNDLDSYGNQQDVDILLQWHQQDPPDNFEIARNEYIYKVQQNRNPFVDHPEWVDCFNFKNLTLTGNCPLDTTSTDGIVDINSSEVAIYPNPIQSKGFVKLQTNNKIDKIEICSIDGQISTIDYSINNNIANFNVEKLSKGLYIVKIYSKDKLFTKKLSKK